MLDKEVEEQIMCIENSPLPMWYGSVKRSLKTSLNQFFTTHGASKPGSKKSQGEVVFNWGPVRGRMVQATWGSGLWQIFGSEAGVEIQWTAYYTEVIIFSCHL